MKPELESIPGCFPATIAKFASFGISAALITPFNGDGTVAVSAAEQHVDRVFNNGATGITLFGTTGEGASIGASERQQLLDSLVGHVAPAQSVTVCICASNLEEAVLQAKQACRFGITKLLVTPPFYFKSVSAEGILLWYEQFISALGQYDVQLIVYNLPQVTQISLSGSLLRSLKDRYGELIFGVKDSSGSWQSAVDFLQNDDLAVLIGDERLLAKAGPLGCAGAISGMANLFPGVLKKLVLSGEEHPGVNELVRLVVRYPVTPLVKHLVALYYDEPIWSSVRPPLLPSNAADVDDMVALVKSINSQP